MDLYLFAKSTASKCLLSFFRQPTVVGNDSSRGLIPRHSTNATPESLQLIDLPSIDWSQDIVAADVEAAECLRLIRAVATEVAMVGVAECDIVDAGIEAAHVATGTTVKKIT